MRELSMHILDLAQNSIVANATKIEIEVIADRQADKLTIILNDNGKGMPPEFLEHVKDPFTTTRTTRRVGLGIPMMVESTRMCDGSFEIHSEVGKGTTLTAIFRLNHIDRAPLGDMKNTMIALIAANPDIDFIYTQKVDDKEFKLDTKEVKTQLEGVPINEGAVLKWLTDYIKEGIGSELEID